MQEIESYCQWFSSAQFSRSGMSNSLWPHGLQQTGLPVHYQLPEFTQTHVLWIGDAIQPSHPLLSPSPPAPNPSQHQVFSNESALCIRWPKYWSFSFSISPSNEHSGLISFRMDLLDVSASGSFQMSQLFASDGQSIEVSASASVLPMNIQDWFPLEWIWISLQSKGLSRVFSSTTVQKHQFFSAQLSL